MMAFIDSVFHVIGSFISMVFEAIVAAVQLGFSVLGGLLGLVVNLGMLLLVVGLVALVITRRKTTSRRRRMNRASSTWTTAKPSRAITASNLQKALVLPLKMWYNQRYPKFSEVKKQ